MSPLQEETFFIIFNKAAFPIKENTSVKCSLLESATANYGTIFLSFVQKKVD